MRIILIWLLDAYVAGFRDILYFGLGAYDIFNRHTSLRSSFLMFSTLLGLLAGGKKKKKKRAVQTSLKLHIVVPYYVGSCCLGSLAVSYQFFWNNIFSSPKSICYCIPCTKSITSQYFVIIALLVNTSTPRPLFAQRSRQRDPPSAEVNLDADLTVPGWKKNMKS